MSANKVSTTVNCSPRKTRLVAGLVRDMNAQEALKTLAVTNKKTSKALAKLIKSACSNLGLTSADYPNALILSINVNEFTKLKRVMPRGKGSAARFTRRWSKINLEMIHLDSSLIKKA